MKHISVCLLLLIGFVGFGQNIKGLTRVVLDTTTAHKGFEVFDNYIADKRMVFSGENHRYSFSNNSIKYKQMMYLYEKGFRYLSLEFGEGIGFLANEYVHTGDEELLKLLFRSAVYDQHPMYWLLQRIKQFNSDKEELDKINIVGLDYTRYPTYSLDAMVYLLDKNNLKDSLPNYHEDIRVIANAQESKDELGFTQGYRRIETFDITQNFRSYTNKLFQLSVKKLLSDYKKDKEKFKYLLPNKDFLKFDKLMEEIDLTIHWYEGEGMTYQIHLDRERHLADRAKELLAMDSTVKISGQFGRCHIRNEEFSFPCYSIDLDSFVARIQKDSVYKNEVAIIPIIYKDENDLTLHEDASVRKLKQYLGDGNIYIYKTSAKMVAYTEEEKNPQFYYINTMKRNEEYLYSSEESKNELLKDYRKNYEETAILELSVLQQGINYNGLNNSLGFKFVQPNTPKFSLGYYYSAGETHYNFRFNYSLPVEQSLDSTDYTFKHWGFSQMIGFNSIFVKNFTFYHGFRMDAGLAKLTEEKVLSKDDFLFGFNTEKRKYTNPFFNVGISTGFQLKFYPFVLFAEGSYMIDVTNNKWRNRGIISQSSELSFSGLELRGGIAFYLRDNWSFK